MKIWRNVEYVEKMCSLTECLLEIPARAIQGSAQYSTEWWDSRSSSPLHGSYCQCQHEEGTNAGKYWGMLFLWVVAPVRAQTALHGSCSGGSWGQKNFVWGSLTNTPYLFLNVLPVSEIILPFPIWSVCVTSSLGADITSLAGILL